MWAQTRVVFTSIRRESAKVGEDDRVVPAKVGAPEEEFSSQDSQPVLIRKKIII